MKRRKRIFWSLILSLPIRRSRIADIIRRYKLFGSVGANCFIPNGKLPLYSELVYLHNNVAIGSNVRFVTHDAIHIMLNNKYGNKDFIEKVGCIEIMDNVFIGSGTRILSNVRIGSNVIIGSNSLVSQDIPDNSVYSGCPAKYVCDFDDFVGLMEDYSECFKAEYGLEKLNGVDKVLASKLYENFTKEKNKKRKH